MKRLFFLGTCFFLVSQLYGQQEEYVDDFSDLAKRKNSVYLEGMGNGGYGSLNYEHLFFRVPHRAIAVRTGLSMTFDSDNFNLIVPVEITAVFGKRNCFETGPGLTFSPGGKGCLYFYRAGYRLRSENGILLRVAPMFLYLPGWYAGPFGGFSLGYSF